MLLGRSNLLAGKTYLKVVNAVFSFGIVAYLCIN